MQILYAPPNWEPRSIPNSEIKNCLKHGYRRSLPVVASSPKAEEPTSPPSEAPSPESGGVSVNTASLKELTALPLVTTAISKKVIAGRPYASIEDLVAKIPDIDWISLEPKLSF